MNGTLIPRFLVIFVLFMTGCGSTTSETKHASSLSNDLIDAAIERYIRTHSKVIVQSLQAMEAKRKAEQRVCQKNALAAQAEGIDLRFSVTGQRQSEGRDHAGQVL